MKNRTLISTIALALVALAWGTSYAIIKDTLSETTPFMLMSIRFGFSAILLALIYIRKLAKVSRRDLARGAEIGIFMFIAFLFLILGIQHTTASKQSFIIGSYVLLVPFLAWIINKKKPDAYDFAGAIMAAAGLGMLTLGGVTGINIGDFYSLICALGFAFHMIMIEKHCNDSDPIILTIIQFAITGGIFVALTLIFETPDISIVKSAALQIFYLVVITTVIAFVVQNIVQRYISSTNTALILTLESVFGSVFAVLYLHEHLSFAMIAGCVIVFLGIITQETKWSFLRKKTPNNSLYK